MWASSRLAAAKLVGYFDSLNNTPGTWVGPGGRDQTLAVKRKGGKLFSIFHSS